MNAGPPRRRVRIERIDIDLRAIEPSTAHSAARSLGPELARHLSSRRGRIAPADRIDAGRSVGPTPLGARDLSAHMAQRIARAMRWEDA